MFAWLGRKKKPTQTENGASQLWVRSMANEVKAGSASPHDSADIEEMHKLRLKDSQELNIKKREDVSVIVAENQEFKDAIMKMANDPLKKDPPHRKSLDPREGHEKTFSIEASTPKTNILRAMYKENAKVKGDESVEWKSVLAELLDYGPASDASQPSCKLDVIEAYLKEHIYPGLQRQIKHVYTEQIKEQVEFRNIEGKLEEYNYGNHSNVFRKKFQEKVKVRVQAEALKVPCQIALKALSEMNPLLTNPQDPNGLHSFENLFNKVAEEMALDAPLMEVAPLDAPAPVSMPDMLPSNSGTSDITLAADTHVFDPLLPTAQFYSAFQRAPSEVTAATSATHMSQQGVSPAADDGQPEQHQQTEFYSAVKAHGEPPETDSAKTFEDSHRNTPRP